MRLLARLQLARLLQREADRGYVLIAVPRDMAGGIAREIWERNVRRAAAKWAARDAQVPLPQWQAVMHARGRDRL